MTLKSTKQQPQQVAPVQAPAPVAFRRIYMDISGIVDAQLEIAARASGKTKKGFVENLIVTACAEAMEQAAGQKRVKK